MAICEPSNDQCSLANGLEIVKSFDFGRIIKLCTSAASGSFQTLTVPSALEDAWNMIMIVCHSGVVSRNFMNARNGYWRVILTVFSLSHQNPLVKFRNPFRTFRAPSNTLPLITLKNRSESKGSLLQLFMVPGSGNLDAPSSSIQDQKIWRANKPPLYLMNLVQKILRSDQRKFRATEHRESWLNTSTCFYRWL